MKKYAKYIDENTVEKAPSVKNGSFFNYNSELNEPMLLADGYKVYDDSALMPNDGKRYVPIYENTDDKIVRKWAVIIEPEKSYAEKRAAEYPPITEYLDAIVKINSGDETLIADGQKQLNFYYQACLEVKARYPKPQEQLEA